MKMNTAQIRQTLHQYQAQALPAERPLMPQLERLSFPTGGMSNAIGRGSAIRHAGQSL